MLSALLRIVNNSSCPNANVKLRTLLNLINDPIVLEETFFIIFNVLVRSVGYTALVLKLMIGKVMFVFFIIVIIASPVPLTAEYMPYHLPALISWLKSQ